jgi:hypothetical protein
VGTGGISDRKGRLRPAKVTADGVLDDLGWKPMAAIGDGVHRPSIAQQPEPRVSVTVPNDEFRRTFVGGLVEYTVGVDALINEVVYKVVAAVQAFDDFTEDNDPHGEHDFGQIEVEKAA